MALFNADVYRELRPDIKEMSDNELMDHWLSQPNYYDLALSIRGQARDSCSRLSELSDDDVSIEMLLSTFPFDYYRRLRSDLSQLSNRELLNHFFEYGQHEGIDLSECSVKEAVMTEVRNLSESQIRDLTCRVSELEQLLSCANAQISAMQGLIAASQPCGVVNE